MKIPKHLRADIAFTTPVLSTALGEIEQSMIRVCTNPFAPKDAKEQAQEVLRRYCQRETAKRFKRG